MTDVKKEQILDHMTDAEIKELQKELEITRAYIHNKGLEWDLISFKKTMEDTSKPKLWCQNQILDENNIITCIAHLAEGRVFDCPYKNNDERLEAHYPCSNYKEINK